MTAAQIQPVQATRPIDQALELERAIAAGLFALSALGVALGFAAAWRNGTDVTLVPYLGCAAFAFACSALVIKSRHGTWPTDYLTIAAMFGASGALCMLLPEYLYGHQLNGIVHRSFFGSLLLLGVGSAASSVALGRALGGTPTARDQALYVIILVPIAVALASYGIVVFRLVERGLDGLSWHILVTPYTQQVDESAFTQQAGLKNHILGTLLLIGMTTGMAIFPGLGAGVFMHEYPGKAAQAVRFCTTMLRAISPFILAVAAFSLVQAASGHPAGDPISDFIRGYYTDENGFKHASKGSFLLAAMFLSLLVMPVIARATEEGLRSLPQEIREGSAALGATEGHGLLRILLPWATPNIATAVLLGAAEAAGSVAILLLIAGTGQDGVGPLREATSLSFAIFETRYGPKPFEDTMLQYQFTAALLLVLLTLALTVAALYLKARLGQRYRGSLTK